MILVTGGAGYIGAHVNKLLNDRGEQTIVFDNLVTGHRSAILAGEFVQGDLCDAADIRRVFEEFDIEAVIHFAALSQVGEAEADPERYYRNNVCGTINLLSAMRSAGVSRLVFSSTAAVYGEPDSVPIPESAPKRPASVYGRTKLMIETMLRDYSTAYGLRYVALRYFNAAGADVDAMIGERHDPESHLIPLVLDAALGRRADIAVFGTDYPTEDGTGIRDYIHVSDLAAAHYSALCYLRTDGASEEFNLGNGAGYSVLEVIRAAESVTGHEIPVVMRPRRPGDVPVLVADAGKARDALGWIPAISLLDDIIASAWRWHQRRVAD